MALPRAIYAALNFSTQKTSQKSELTATEIAVQVWKMVHYCKGDKDKLYENLNTDGTEQIQQLKGRDTCVARFVDGKYEDPDKKKRPLNPARPAQLMAPAQAFGGFAPRPHCPGTLGADDSLTTYENGRCRRPRTDEYWVGQSVRVLAKSGEWKEASILALPDANKKVRVKNREGVPTNPWFRVRFEEPVCEDKGAANEGGRVCSVMVNRIRPSEERQAQTIAARKAVEDENATFKEEQRRRREAEFKNQEQRIVELRKSLYLSPEGAPMAGERRRHEQKAKEIMRSLLEKLRDERAPPPRLLVRRRMGLDVRSVFSSNLGRPLFLRWSGHSLCPPSTWKSMLRGRLLDPRDILEASRDRVQEEEEARVQEEVMYGTALQTVGELKAKDLDYNSQGEIVSKKKRLQGLMAKGNIKYWTQFVNGIRKSKGVDLGTAMTMAKDATNTELARRRLPATPENKRTIWAGFLGQQLSVPVGRRAPRRRRTGPLP
eukprot:jgi/Mesvir1/11456/Mv19786-RA.1